jgi:EF hand
MLHPQRSFPMTRHILVLAAVTFALASSATAARAEDDSDDSAMIRQWEQAQQNPGDEDDTGMMGHGAARHCIRQCMAEGGMMGQDWGKRGMMRQGGMMRPFAMRMIFALMDRDGDGTISLQEFQAAHESIFKAMDADKDGTVSMEEMRDFLHGADKVGLPQRSTPRD